MEEVSSRVLDKIFETTQQKYLERLQNFADLDQKAIGYVVAIIAILGLSLFSIKEFKGVTLGFWYVRTFVVYFAALLFSLLSTTVMSVRTVAPGDKIVEMIKEKGGENEEAQMKFFIHYYDVIITRTKKPMNLKANLLLGALVSMVAGTALLGYTVYLFWKIP